MPPAKLPYVYLERHSKTGKLYCYFRRDKQSKRIKLPLPTDPDHERAYLAALSGVELSETKRGSRYGTLAWLCEQYRLSSDYRALGKGTRRARDNIIKNVCENAGEADYRAIRKSHILRGKEERAARPGAARNFLDAMRGLFRWALEHGFVDTDPTDGVKNPQRKKTEGFKMWEEAEVQAFRDFYPLGTNERVWIEVLICSGARRGDAVTLGRQHVRNDCLAIRTQKEDVWAYPPIMPELRAAIKAGPVGDLTFVVGKGGGNLAPESFGNEFRKACRRAGINKSAHGLRKYSATRYAEMGLTEAELEAIFGWVRGSNMAAYYSKNAERKRIAESAKSKIIKR